ncbi:MAG TPA: helical backbone metal receptor [Longimicrobiales bacterium]|nr:helical backbone metal receptor [Longimicrobiales bacterium]
MVTDAEGRAVVVAPPPERIVSLVPSATRVLLDLGAGDRLVGRTEHDTLAALAALPSVGGGLHPTLEVLLSLEPDLVIRFAGPSDRETPRRLDEVGVTHVAIAPESVADTRRMILMLGRVVDRAGPAEALVAAIDSALADVRTRVAGLEPVRTAWVVGGEPPWVSGPGTYIDELISLAGGENVFRDLGRLWGGVSLEALVARRPDLVLTSEGSRLDPRIGRVLRVRRVSPVVSLPGPDLPRAAREIARALHPGAFR